MDIPAVRNNRALAYLKQKLFLQAEEDLHQVILAEPHNIKALVRRSCARKG